MISLFRELVCEVYGISTREFNSRSKRRHIVEARTLFYALCLDANMVDKEIVTFMGRSIQSTRTYQEMLRSKHSERYIKNYKRCKPQVRQIMRICKNSSAVHPITRYTKAEEFMMLQAMFEARKFMLSYGRTSENTCSRTSEQNELTTDTSSI